MLLSCKATVACTGRKTCCPTCSSNIAHGIVSRIPASSRFRKDNCAAPSLRRGNKLLSRSRPLSCARREGPGHPFDSKQQPGQRFDGGPAQADEIIIGNSFVIKRQRAGASPNTAIVPVHGGRGALARLNTQQQSPPCLGLQLYAALGPGGAMVPYDVARCSVMVADTSADLEVHQVEEYEVEVLHQVEEGHLADALNSAGRFAPTDCTGIVHVPQQDEDEEQLLEGRSQQDGKQRSPRRTGRLRFTCNLCESVNTKPINPHAWDSGTVFARCAGCGVVHRLVDNLNLVDEIVYRDEQSGGGPKASSSPRHQRRQQGGSGAGQVFDPEVLGPLEGEEKEDDVVDDEVEGVERRREEQRWSGGRGPGGRGGAPMVVGDLVVPRGLVPEPDNPLDN